MKRPLRFAMVGTGFWARYQLHGWRELPGCTCVALCDRTRAKAEALGREFGIEAVYDSVAKLLDKERLDFVDIVASPGQHAPLARAAADRGLPVICQKPLAPDYRRAAALVGLCRRRRVPLLVNENWRWQTQIRALAAVLRRAPLGTPWRAHVRFASSFPIFENQPFLRELHRFILADIGTHLFDVVRFLFGEARTAYAQGHRINPGIRGEDAVSTLFQMVNGMTVYADLSYASRLAGERFPEVFITVEGEDASVSLDRDYKIRIATRRGVTTSRHPPPRYAWADPRYGIVHSSIVDTQRHLLAALRGEIPAETTGADNLKTLRMVFACYESIRRRACVKV